VLEASSDSKESWARTSLEADGFKGWITFAELAQKLSELPATGGVYIVWWRLGHRRSW
jgi:hypothetical protein